ncbi:MAG TPA: hypothetical protein VJT75_07755 [Thermoleophilaceae bacterium]|nr:hypothetical protein [Thermoleophilaceae bacterium]
MEQVNLDEGRQAALEVMLLMADADARWWNYDGAVALLDSAQAAVGFLPADYELKRARWRRLREARRLRPSAWSRRAA